MDGEGGRRKGSREKMEEVEEARMRLGDKSSPAKRLKITQLLLSAATRPVKAVWAPTLLII